MNSFDIAKKVLQWDGHPDKLLDLLTENELYLLFGGLFNRPITGDEIVNRALKFE